MADVSLGASAEKLARNPIGIFALFLLLVYGIASIVVGAASFTPMERLPLVWFLVLFPVMVLSLFSWLVVKHHTKLYGPGDFLDREGFFRALTVGEQRQKVEAEVATVQADVAQAGDAVDETVAGTPERRRREVRTAVVLAEELAFRELETEFKFPVVRHVRLASGMLIDGLIRTPTPTAVEIKYTNALKNAVNMVDRAAKQAKQIADASTTGPIRFLLVVVLKKSTLDDRERVAQLVRQKASTLQLQLETRVYDFGELQEKFDITLA